jgi:hypothetical protein
VSTPNSPTPPSTCRCGLRATATLSDALSNRFDQLLGWAKAGKTPDGEYYLMNIENIDDMRGQLLLAVKDETHTHAPGGAV